MPAHIWTRAVAASVIVAAAVGLVAVGRATADTSAARDRGYAAGKADGVAAGEADGQRVGRAIQATLPLPSDMRSAARDAFDAGYTAGSNDVFSRYDGGWDVAVPYVVVLDRGSGAITYRIASSTRMLDGVDYRMCPRSTALCQSPRP